MTVLSPTVVLAVCLIVGGAAWLLASGWPLVVGGVVLLAAHAFPK